MDLLLGSFLDAGVSWLQGNGNGTFGPKTFIGTCLTPYPTAEDMDNDGDLDVLCFDVDLGGAYVFL